MTLVIAANPSLAGIFFNQLGVTSILYNLSANIYCKREIVPLTLFLLPQDFIHV